MPIENAQQGTSNISLRGRLSLRRWASAIGLLLIFGVGLERILAVPITTTGEKILQFQFETKTQGSPGDPFVWSPDGRRLLSGMTMRDSSGEVRASLWLFDVADDKAVGHRVLDGRGAAILGIAWSLDGELVAIVESRQIRVFSARDFSEIAHREISTGDPELDNLQRINLSSGVAFSKDSKSLWIARPAENVRNRFTLAVELDAHSLSVIGHYDIDPPIAGNRTVARRTAIEATPNGPRLVALVDSYTGIIVLGADTARDFVYGIDLSTKAEFFPHFQLVDKNRRFQYLAELLLSSDTSTVASFLGVTTDRRQDLQDYRDVDVYRTETGQRIALLDTAQTLKDEQTARKFFGRTSEVVIATSHRRSDKAPGLIAYDVKSGAIVQRITGQALDPRLAFSLDRKRMVGGLIYSPVMQFYSVNR